MNTLTPPPSSPSSQRTQDIYDAQAPAWERNARQLLSDFTARPYVIQALGGDLSGAQALDLGCGEGYVARLAAQAGAARVQGYDLSSHMIAQAISAIPADTGTQFSFEVAHAATLSLPARSYSHAMAVFLFNYLSVAEMTQVLKLVRRVLRPGGVFVATVPHPCYAFMRPMAAPFYFDAQGQRYMDSVDTTFEGRIWRLDGQDVHVRCVHKTWSDYFHAFAAAGWSAMPVVEELSVSAADVADAPNFLGSLQGYPLHVLFRLQA